MNFRKKKLAGLFIFQSHRLNPTPRKEGRTDLMLITKREGLAKADIIRSLIQEEVTMLLTTQGKVMTNAC